MVGGAGQVSVNLERAGDHLYLRISSFDDWLPRQAEDVGAVVFETTGPFIPTANAIASGLKAVLDEYGEQEYRRRWVEHPFPVDLPKRALDRLRPAGSRGL